jgi:hypothetical protein
MFVSESYVLFVKLQILPPYRINGREKLYQQSNPPCLSDGVCYDMGPDVCIAMLFLTFSCLL